METYERRKRQIEVQNDKRTEKHIDRWIYSTDMNRHADWHSRKKTQIPTERQTDRQKDGEMDRQTD